MVANPTSHNISFLKLSIPRLSLGKLFQDLVLEKRASRKISIQSFQKYRTTAINVPKCKATSNESPGSEKRKSHGARIKWAELEIGRNSDAPWIIPRIRE